jgi:hypothetical protein
MSTTPRTIAEIVARCRQWLSRPESEWPAAAADCQRDALVQRLSEALYHQALAEGGWAVDAGLLGPEAFVADATAIIEAIAVGNAQDGPPTP